MQEGIHPQGGHDAKQAGCDESKLPALGRNYGGTHEKGQALADRVRSVPETIAAPAFMKAEPVGDRDDR